MMCDLVLEREVTVTVEIFLIAYRTLFGMFEFNNHDNYSDVIIIQAGMASLEPSAKLLAVLQHYI